jgi:TonB family protein
MTCPSCEATTDASSRRCASCGEALPVSPGWVIADRYEIQAPLGEGGMGSVFRARDRALHVMVAFKVLRVKQDPTAVRRFHHEVTLARKVRHENVCAVYEYGEDEGLLYCTMELVGGTNLHEVLRAQAPLPVDRAYGLALKAAAGLQAIHEAGVLHRDLKTSNIMIDAKERVRLVDFGIARAMPTPEQEVSTTATPTTGHESIVGTPAYMSPEQVMGWPVDARSDIYSFGVVLFELFTGQLPFHGSRAAILRKQLDEPPPLHGPLAQSLPIGLAAVLERAMAKDPDLRHADVAELIRDLERTRDSFHTDTMDVPPAIRKRRWLLPAFALVALVAALVRNQIPPQGPHPVSSTIPSPIPSASVPPPSPPPSPTPRTISPLPSRPSAKPRPSPAPTTPPSTMIAPTFPTTLPTTLPPIVVPPPTTMPPVTTSTVPSKPVERPPECLSCPLPPYPKAAEKYGAEGRVELEIMVDARGNVTTTRVLRGDSPFRGAAQKAVKAWRFVPASRGGVPVEYMVTKIVEFKQSPPP